MSEQPQQMHESMTTSTARDQGVAAADRALELMEIDASVLYSSYGTTQSTVKPGSSSSSDTKEEEPVAEGVYTW